MNVNIRRVVVGTAGHIDHGKTSLIASLTGVDCDRWQEEKSRGITIDLGFAHSIEGDLQIGFVDVPGHERFVHNALAGLGGIRLMMLVVAADEGVKPQTVEHLDICSLLDIPAGLVALTKTDLVEPDLLELAELELEEALQGTPFEGAPIVKVSNHTGEGVEDVRAKLVELAEEAHAGADLTQLPARLPIDRSFHLKGLGVLVTGTLVSGEIGTGDEMVLQPQGAKARVRSVQVHGSDRNRAYAGERTSLQLVGVDLDEVGRGDQATVPGAFAVGQRWLAHFRLLPSAPKPIAGFLPVRVHVGSAERLGKLRPVGDPIPPGGEGLVEVRVDAPTVAARGDRFVVRRPSPQTTLGGGTVLDPRLAPLRGAQLRDAAAGIGGDLRQATVAWAALQGESGLALEDLVARLGQRPEDARELLGGLVSESQLVLAPAGAGHGERWLVPGAVAEVSERARRVLKAYFKENRMASGIPKAEALRRILPSRGQELADVYLDWLAKQKVVVIAGDELTQPGRGSQFTDAETKHADSIVTLFEQQGLQPSAIKDVQAQLGIKPQIFEGLVKHLVRQKRLVRLPDGLFIAASALEKLRADLFATNWQTFAVPQFKDHFGLTRKWAIPLLEYLDSQRVTKRMGNEREILRPR